VICKVPTSPAPILGLAMTALPDPGEQLVTVIADMLTFT
jgi:hypothetical protein